MVQESQEDHSYSASSIHSTSAAEPQDVAVQVDVVSACILLTINVCVMGHYTLFSLTFQKNKKKNI